MAEKRPAAGRPLWLVITLVSILMALAGIGAAYLTTTFLSDAWSRGQINLVDRFTRGTPNPDCSEPSMRHAGTPRRSAPRGVRSTRSSCTSTGHRCRWPHATRSSRG